MESDIGRRMRDIRKWREMSLRATAGLAGLSASYLSELELGKKPVEKRQILENVARALRVSPVELTGKPYKPADPIATETLAAMNLLEDSLTGWWVGEVPSGEVRPWPQVAADVDRLNTILRPATDYAAQAALLPTLVRELLVYATDPKHDRDALLALVQTYHAAGAVAQRLGIAGLPAVAVERMQGAAERLGDPVWISVAEWSRAHLLSSSNRVRQYELAVRAADSAPQERPETRGMANLTAALAAASRGDQDTARTHLEEAVNLAEVIGADVSGWPNPGMMQFGRTNVAIWQTSIGVELGEGARVARYAEGINLSSIPIGRQAAYWMDFGRALASERKTRDKGLAALLRAEKMAPQQIRNNEFARETVSSLLGTALRDAGGRELRGLAWRMGIAPTG